MNEKLISVGEKILDQLAWETDIGTLDKSIGYFEGVLERSESKKWILRNEKTRSSNFIRDIHGCAIGTEDGQNDTIYTRANTVYRDSPLGRLLTKGVGSHSHTTPIGKTISIEINILSKYLTDGRGDAVNGEIAFQENNQEFKFSSLIRDLEKIKRLKNDINKDETRLNEIEKETEEAKILIAKIDRKEKQISALKQKVQKHIAKEVALRDQPMLDKYQEEVKRSKILNGSFIINGGPGTGKTTSLIQRINYLTSPTIEEEIGELTKEQREVLYNQNTGWIFYSPTNLLKSYLKIAMEAESLSMEENVRTWDSHRKILLRQTGLINVEKQRPFISKTIKNGIYFKPGYEVYNNINGFFLDYILEKQSLKIKRIHDEQIFTKLSSKYNEETVEKYRLPLMKLGVKMKDSSLPALRYRKIESWVPFYINYSNEFADEFKVLNSDLTKEIKLEAGKLHVKIISNSELSEWFTSIIQEEIRNKEDLIEDEEEDEEEEEEEIIESVDIANIEILMIQKLIRFIRNIALREIDGSNTKISAKNKVLLERLESFLNKTHLQSIGVRLYFKKYFEKPTKGLESNLLSDIPRLYKQFRRMLFKNNPEILTKYGLTAFDKNLSNGNKHLYEEEADYLLAIIFGLCKRIYRDRKQYFKDSNHQYINTFKNNIKGVVAIDEATDFSIWELSAMTNLSHPLFDSVTLSGDLMQRLTERGISSWIDYVKTYPKTEIKDLKIAYRQTAKLLKIATEIYSWNVNSPAEFYSYFPDDPLDPSPLLIVSDNEDAKHKWLVERIIEIQKLYGTEFPTVAIFVKDDEEVVKLANALKEFEILEEIGVDVVPCVQGQILGNKQSVRIYSIEFIKGLEFGAVFFHNLDDLSLHDDTLTNKYIYVGLSRANLFLGVTMNEEFNEELQFLSNHFLKGNWQDYAKGYMAESNNMGQL